MPEKTALITGSDPSMTKHTEHVRALDVEGAYNVPRPRRIRDPRRQDDPLG